MSILTMQSRLADPVSRIRCKFCCRDVTRMKPAANTDRAWQRLGREHRRDCEWIASRGYRKEFQFSEGS